MSRAMRRAKKDAPEVHEKLEQEAKKRKAAALSAQPSYQQVVSRFKSKLRTRELSLAHSLGSKSRHAALASQHAAARAGTGKVASTLKGHKHASAAALRAAMERSLDRSVTKRQAALLAGQRKALGLK